MRSPHCYENYPFWFILVSNIVQLSIYAIGIIIMFSLKWIWVSLYILYLIILEIRLLKTSCTKCYYYGKYCAFGKGKVSSLLFKKSPEKFIHMKLTWKDILPDFLVSLIPMIVGIVLLIMQFDWLVLTLIILLFLLTFIGNSLVRGRLACKYCKQRELGCAAEQMFNKKK